jgi:hypothetical protein
MTYQLNPGGSISIGFEIVPVGQQWTEKRVYALAFHIYRYSGMRVDDESMITPDARKCKRYEFSRIAPDPVMAKKNRVS